MSGAKGIPYWTESAEVQSSRIGSLILSLSITAYILLFSCVNKPEKILDKTVSVETF